MKASQGIFAAILLSIMVFGLTFAMNYLGGFNDSKSSVINKEKPITTTVANDEASNQELTFLQKVYPADGISAIENEFKIGGGQDYLFSNDGPKNLRVGLDSKNCTCTSVLIYSIPNEWLKNNFFLADSKGVYDLSKLEVMLSTVGVKAELEKEITPVALEKYEEPLLAPGSIGWVRLKWKTEKMGPNRLTSNLWMGKKGSGNEVRLEAMVNVQSALFVDQAEVSVDVLSPLISEKKVVLKCYSSTRKAFDFVARISRPRPDETLVVSKPIPLTQDELRADEKLLNMPILLSGYRVPISVSYSVPGGKDLMELGPFSRQIEFIISKYDGKELEQDTRVESRITGKVEGEFRILDAEQKGRLSFGVFPRTLGTKKELKIETDLPNIDLELDALKTVPYLKVKGAPGWPQDVAGRRTWKYLIEILPNTVSGPFPRDDEFFRDSAFYLKSKGNAGRSIRIPAEGRADN